MDIRLDRSQIARLLVQHFPSMADATSDEWHGFLDEMTGLQTPHDETNATAFDRWRQALKAQGYPVWGVTPEKAAAIKTRVDELKAKEALRKTGEEALLVELRKEAPRVTAADLMKQTADLNKKKAKPLVSP